MTPQMQAKPLETLVPAAAESVATIGSCYAVIAAMELPNVTRVNVAVALLYASIDQARSACFLAESDAQQSLFAALILLRSQVDQLMRSAFFAGPATDEELEFYLANDKLPRRNGDLLGPISLSRINEEHFNWQPAGRIPATIESSWGTLSGMTHGGRALLNFYIGEDGIGPYPPTDEFIEVLTNAVVLAHLAVSISLSMAQNSESDELQQILRAWHDAGHEYFRRWAPRKVEATE